MIRERPGKADMPALGDELKGQIAVYLEDRVSPKILQIDRDIFYKLTGDDGYLFQAKMFNKTKGN